MTISKRFIELTEMMRDIHTRKNIGYSGDSDDPWLNFRQSELFGVSAFDACMVRASDKFMRVASLRKNPNNNQVSESIKDSLIDLANYVVIAICLYEEEEENRKENNVNENRISTSETDIKNGNEYSETTVFWGGGE